MNTIILFWNPDISSYTIERLREDLSNYAHVGNWSVWEHDKAHKGDRFFMVRCGKGQTGICMSGRFRSEPYQDEDWSGKGREVYYMDLMADTVIDPDLLPILSTELLSKKIFSSFLSTCQPYLSTSANNPFSKHFVKPYNPISTCSIMCIVRMSDS